MWLVWVVQIGPHLSERRFECASCDAMDVRLEIALNNYPVLVDLVSL